METPSAGVMDPVRRLPLHVVVVVTVIMNRHHLLLPRVTVRMAEGGVELVRHDLCWGWNGRMGPESDNKFWLALFRSSQNGNQLLAYTGARL